jgi:hypothetical protein
LSWNEEGGTSFDKRQKLKNSNLLLTCKYDIKFESTRLTKKHLRSKHYQRFEIHTRDRCTLCIGGWDIEKKKLGQKSCWQLFQEYTGNDTKLDEKRDACAIFYWDKEEDVRKARNL